MEIGIIEKQKNIENLRNLISQLLKAELHTLDREAIYFNERILITYDAGKEFSVEVNESAKKRIVEFLYEKGVRVFHSPTKSTIVFLPSQQRAFAFWHGELTALFAEKSFGDDFYYSINYIPAGSCYYDKPNEDLNMGIDIIISQLLRT